ncbi:hypothetical protein BH23ACT5_BH23ACT5_02210 [soil metagenome]
MVVGGLVGAVLAYIFQAVGTRVLGVDGFAPIAAIWTAFFILASVLLVPLEQYATREVSRGRSMADDRKVFVWVMTIGVVAGAMFVFTMLESLFDGDPVYVVVMSLLVIGYAVLFTAKGVLAGNRRFADIGWVLGLEGVFRLVAGLALLALVVDASALAWAMVIAPLSAVVLRFWRHDRSEGVIEPVGARGFLGAYIGASSASQILLAGAPLGVIALGGSRGLFAAVFVLFTLYRAPLTLIYSLQSRILPHLVTMAGNDDDAGLRRIAIRVIGVGTALTVLGGLVGWLVGPQVVALLFSEEARPVAVVAALTAAGVMAASTAQIGGQVLVARANTGALAVAWAVGLTVAVVVMVASAGSPDLRVAIGFLSGELVAMSAVGFLITRS